MRCEYFDNVLIINGEEIIVVQDFTNFRPEGGVVKTLDDKYFIIENIYGGEMGVEKKATEAEIIKNCCYFGTCDGSSYIINKKTNEQTTASDYGYLDISILETHKVFLEGRKANKKDFCFGAVIKNGEFWDIVEIE